jgi:hypothetical protein
MNTASYKIANINNKTEKPTNKLNSQKGVVFSPKEGLSYAHHSFICFFKGKFYACFSCGKKNEDDCGQSVMLATSYDGLTWSEPYAVISPSFFNKPKAVLTASGFYSDGDTLNLYFGYFEYAKIGEDGYRLAVDAHHTSTQLFVMRSSDGINWSEPIGLNLPMVANHPPQITSSGRLIISGSILFPTRTKKTAWTDGKCPAYTVTLFRRATLRTIRKVFTRLQSQTGLNATLFAKARSLRVTACCECYSALTPIICG